jgi:nitrate reductase (cytochrome), electron transfer subunit
MTPETVHSGAVVIASVVLGLSFAGYLHGTAQNENIRKAPLRDISRPLESVDVPTAGPYLDMRNMPRSAPVLPANLATLADKVPARHMSVDLPESNKTAALDARSELRAYHGAPPVIPHPIAQDTAPACMACHEKGIRFGALRAAPIPHQVYTSCTQCHAAVYPNQPWGERSQGLLEDPRNVENSFAGAQSPNAGPRWTQIAPPAVAHDTFMHERCISCHGPNGRDALRSTHPQRQNCLQCHVMQAPLEQRPGGRLNGVTR